MLAMDFISQDGRRSPSVGQDGEEAIVIFDDIKTHVPIYR